MLDDWEKAVEVLNKGGVAVLPTDTIYGLHCLASDKLTVERIYKIKGRDFNKPFYYPNFQQSDLKGFGITVDVDLADTLDNYWPGPNSIILPIPVIDLSTCTAKPTR